MARKIRLTEKNLQQIVSRVIKESQLLKEADLEVECNCGNDCMCYGTFDGSTMHCECCADTGIDGCGEEKPDDGKFGGMGDMMAMDKMRMRESYNRLKRNQRRR